MELGSSGDSACSQAIPVPGSDFSSTNFQGIVGLFSDRFVHFVLTQATKSKA